MIKKIVEKYCDICGKKIETGEYSCRFLTMNYKGDGVPYADGKEIENNNTIDFCKDCIILFSKWRMSRSGAIGETQQT